MKGNDVTCKLNIQQFIPYYCYILLYQNSHFIICAHLINKVNLIYMIQKFEIKLLADKTVN